MTLLRLALRSLSHHWRTNLAVLLGVVAGTAVIGGALIVGDSVRASLVKMTLDRLGKIDFALSGPRFFREQLADDLNQVNASDGEQIAPAIVMIAGLQSKVGETTRRAGQVNVYGFDDRAWSLIETAGVAKPQGNGVVLSAQAAVAINAKAGDEVTLWIELPSAVPRDTLLGKKDNDSQEITLKVRDLAPEESGLSKLGLHPTQALPLNAFVDLHVLQERLGLEEVKPTRRDPTHKPARVNALLAMNPLLAAFDLSAEARRSPNPNNPSGNKLKSLGAIFTRRLHEQMTLADLNLRIVEDTTLKCLVVESEQMILEEKLAEAAFKAAEKRKLATSPVMVYLANKLWNPNVYDPEKDQKQLVAAAPMPRPTKPQVGYSMYSTVAGLDVLDLDGTPFGGFEFVGEKPKSLGEDEVILNEWLATDLQVKVGGQFKFTYHTIGSRGELPELERTVTVRGIVKMTGAAIDRALTPEVKGITDVDSLSDWDQPFEMDLDAVTARDDDYWDEYRATPKMFLSLKQAQKLWPSRYGSLTSLRLGRGLRAEGQGTEKREADTSSVPQPSALASQPVAEAILNHIDPAELGLAFQPVKAIGLMAAKGSNDFSGLFLGFSMFLIVAAMILIGLLFRLGIEQRVRDLGLLGAVGFTPQQVQRQMLLEGLCVVVGGAFVGTFVAIGYAKLMIYGLTHWWVGAIGTRNLILSAQPMSLVSGFGIAVVAALISIWWALRQLKGLSLREQLAGVTEKESDLATQRQRAQRSMRRAAVCAVAALVLTATILIGAIPATAAFFGVGILLLAASLSFLSAWLQGGVRSAELGVRGQDGNDPESSSLSTSHSEFRARSLAVRGRGVAAFGRLGLRNASRQRLRSVMTAGLIATATFLIVTVAAFRRDPTSELPDKKSGNGGFTLVAESSSPVLYDINTAEGRKKLQIEAPEGSAKAKALAAMNVVPLRVKPGEDASCLNLYQARVPTILGVPQSLIDEGRFAFASGSWKELVEGQKGEVATAARSSNAQPTTLNPQPTPFPVLGDMNTLMFSLHKQVGQTIKIPNDEHPQHELKIAGMFQDSVFQGVLVMNEDDFLKAFPEQKGFRYFLIEVPPELADAAASLLETELSAYGFDAEPVAERLARFLSVQNTYLSTFQTLGGLGLLLGTFGLATVMLRNVLERQIELALLRAVGYRAGQVATLVLWENAFVLLWGLAAGALSALIAVAPNLTSRGGDVPLGSLTILLAIVFATGMLAAIIAVRAAVRLPIVTTLRGE